MLGGVINVPALLSVSLPIHFAVAPSTLVIFFTSLSGALVHSGLGQVNLDYLVIYSIGAVIGAFTGANLAPRIRSEHLTKVFGLFHLIIVFYYGGQGICMRLTSVD